MAIIENGILMVDSDIWFTAISLHNQELNVKADFRRYRADFLNMTVVMVPFQ